MIMGRGGGGGEYNIRKARSNPEYVQNKILKKKNNNNNGSIAGPKRFAPPPPSRQDQTFRIHPFCSMQFAIKHCDGQLLSYLVIQMTYQSKMLHCLRLSI